MSTFQIDRLQALATGHYSPLIKDYLKGDPQLDAFIAQQPTVEGIAKAIAIRKKQPVDRLALQNYLADQYAELPKQEAVIQHIALLKLDTTFTVCAAHQPNLFTGPAYFIYKIAHAIQLARRLKTEFPDNDFVPVYFMGSEDNDLDELGHVYLHGEKISWDTDQEGAVGRMLVNDSLCKMRDQISTVLNTCPFGEDVRQLLDRSFVSGRTVQQSMMHLVHLLFGQFGLLVFIPDHPVVKQSFKDILLQEVSTGASYAVLNETLQQFPKSYKIQATGRPINLFYLKDGLRKRIDPVASGFSIADTSLHFSLAELRQEIEEHPERFSPNVVLRPVLQEKILPNVAFIGGAGELAYWLELKAVFERWGVPMPPLFLRNSILLISSEQSDLLKKLRLTTSQLFKGLKSIIKQQISMSLDIQQLRDVQVQSETLLNQLMPMLTAVDPTLVGSLEAMKTRNKRWISGLETKLIRAEKRNQEAYIRQLEKAYSSLFPNGQWQERTDNFFQYYAKYGADLIAQLIAAIQPLDPTVLIFEENK
jgi:bacillithiol biosynthesis cysteine-adding enzyme BshC